MIEKLNVISSFSSKEKAQVPIGIKKIASEKIIPNILPKNSLSTSLCTNEKNWMLKTDKNKLNNAGEIDKTIVLCKPI